MRADRRINAETADETTTSVSERVVDLILGKLSVCRRVDIQIGSLPNHFKITDRLIPFKYEQTIKQIMAELAAYRSEPQTDMKTNPFGVFGKLLIWLLQKAWVAVM